MSQDRLHDAKRALHASLVTRESTQAIREYFMPVNSAALQLCRIYRRLLNESHGAAQRYEWCVRRALVPDRLHLPFIFPCSHPLHMFSRAGTHDTPTSESVVRLFRAARVVRESCALLGCLGPVPVCPLWPMGRSPGPLRASGAARRGPQSHNE